MLKDANYYCHKDFQIFLICNWMEKKKKKENKQTKKNPTKPKNTSPNKKKNPNQPPNKTKKRLWVSCRMKILGF